MGYAALVAKRPEPELSKALAGRLAALRKKAGISQEELASRAKVSRATVGNLESGFSGNPEYETVKKLAAALGVQAADLLDQQTGLSEMASLVDRFEASFWNREFLKPSATAEELAYLRSLPPLRWVGREPNEETLGRMLEAIRSADPKSK